MVRPMNKYVLIKLASVVISAFSQIILKVSANKEYDSRIKEYLNPHVIISYGIFLLCTLLGTYSLKGNSLSLSSMIEALSYILIPSFSYIFLKEKLSRRQLIGIVIIFIGFIIYSL